jgi:anti-sigma factor RsiW
MEDQSLTNALRAGPECPSIERLGRYADGALTPEERRREESHIASCANCQAELALLHAFANPALRDDEAEVVRWGVEQLQRREPEIFDGGRKKAATVRRWLSFGRLRPVLALAVVLLAVGSGYYMFNPAPPGLPTDIGSGPEATRTLRIVVQGPVGDRQAVPTRLEWQPVSGASRYRVRLTEVDRHEIWSSDTINAAIDLPPDVRAHIVPGKTLVWQVTAYNASNATIAESNAERFRLVR